MDFSGIQHHRDADRPRDRSRDACIHMEIFDPRGFVPDDETGADDDDDAILLRRVASRVAMWAMASLENAMEASR